MASNDGDTTSSATGSNAVNFASFADRYEKGTGGATREVARKLMALSPPFTSESKILDNATGTGIVIEEIQRHISSTDPNSTVKIPVIAADAAKPMIEILDAKIKHIASTNAWPNLHPLTTHAIAAEKLDSTVIPDNSITHAYMNFGLFFCSDAVLAASHIYRSLAPGGIALITSWHNLSYMVPVRQTHKLHYPEEPDIKMPFSDSWEDPAYVKDLLVKAGFSGEDIAMVKEDTFMRFKDVQEMAANKTELFTVLIKGPEGWKSEEAKREFAERLGGLLMGYEHFRDEGDRGVSLRMVANVAVCRK